MNVHKSVTLLGVFSVASGAMISSGIFILPSLVYGRIGPAVPLAYLMAGLFALLGALAVVELATAMPKAGGDYFFVNKTFGPALGTVSGLLGWIALGLKSAFAIYGISVFLAPLTGLPLHVLSFALCLLFTGINCIGVREAAWLQTLFVAFLLALMAVYAGYGFSVIEWSGVTGLFSGTKPVSFRQTLVSAGFVFVSFGGLLKVANLSEEVANPRKDIPLGMLASIAIVTVLYVLIAVAVTAALSPSEFLASLTPVADAAGKTLGRAGYWIMTIAALLAFITTANAGIMAASRYPLALARDGLVPPALGNLAPKAGTPVPATLLTGGFVFLSLLLPLETLVKSASTVILASYALTNLSVIVLRESKIAGYRPTFRAPLYPWLQIGSVIIFSYFIVALGSESVEITGAFLLAGFCLYFFYGKKGNRAEFALLHLMRRIADRRIIGNTLENELIDIVIHRDNIEQDAFDELLKDCEIIDIDRPMAFSRVAGKISRKIADRYGLDADRVYGDFLRRQRETNTAISEFLAIPHVVIDGDDRMFLYVVRCLRGMHFTSAQPAVKAAFFLGGSAEKRLLHLKALAAIALLAEEPGFEERWLSAESSMELRNGLLMSERKRMH